MPALFILQTRTLFWPALRLLTINVWQPKGLSEREGKWTMSATTTYEPVFNIINEMKNSMGNKKEQKKLLMKLFAVANQAKSDFDALDKEVKKMDVSAEELKAQIKNLQLLLNM